MQCNHAGLYLGESSMWNVLPHVKQVACFDLDYFFPIIIIFE